MTDGKQYWWSLSQHRVVTADEAKAEDRLGPYATEAEARNALARVADRNEDWDNDPRFHDPIDPMDDQRFDGSPRFDEDELREEQDRDGHAHVPCDPLLRRS